MGKRKNDTATHLLSSSSINGEETVSCPACGYFFGVSQIKQHILSHHSAWFQSRPLTMRNQIRQLFSPVQKSVIESNQQSQTLAPDSQTKPPPSLILCPRCGIKVSQKRLQNHLARCKYENDLAEDKAAWMASGHTLCHYLANLSSAEFICGVKVGKHSKVDSTQFTKCVQCRKALGLPVQSRSKAGKRRKPQSSKRLIVFQGGGFESNRRRH